MIQSRPPHANAYAERFVLTANPRSPDRMLNFSERHLRIVLAEHARLTTDVKWTAPHRSRQLHPPGPTIPSPTSRRERIKLRPVLGGLINQHERAA